MPVIQYKCNYCDFTSLDKTEVELHEHIVELPVTCIKQDNEMIEAIVQVSREVNGIQFIFISDTDNRKFVLSYDHLNELDSLLTQDNDKDIVLFKVWQSK